MKFKTQLFMLALIGVVCSCIVLFSIRLGTARAAYQQQIVHKIQDFLVHQQTMLQLLSKQAAPLIQQQDWVSLSALLRMYEDQTFGLAKQGLTVPVNAQWVSLNAPPQIITSYGAGETQLLAPDEAYYLRIVANPTQLEASTNYTRHAMPEHTLFNLGLGIMLAEQNLGQMDVSMALTSVQNYLAGAMPDNKFFTFNLVDLQQPQINTNRQAYLFGLAEFLIFGSLSFIFMALVASFSRRVYIHVKQQAATITSSQQRITELEQKCDLATRAQAVQLRYGQLTAAAEANATQLIYLHELFADVVAVNAEYAALRDVQVELPHIAKQSHIIGNGVRLMQILSGMLYAILQQLPRNSTITIQLMTIDLPPDKRQFVFKFQDDGFYNTLPEQHELPSNADIRAKGWTNILRLIELEGGSFEHAHTAYSGNNISFSLLHTIAKNVVPLESYLA